MIFKKQSNTKLKYAKAKAKATEFQVEESEMPKFPKDSDDLHYSSVFAISSYVDARLEGESAVNDLLRDLGKAASFYDAASTDRRNERFSDGFWTIAVAAYFLLGNYGSAKVALSRISDRGYYGSNAKAFLNLVGFLIASEEVVPNGFEGLGAFLRGKGSRDDIDAKFSNCRSEETPEDLFFGRIIMVAVKDAIRLSSRQLLPEFSGLPLEVWRDYLEHPKACRILWQAQARIGEAGVFSGRSAFIQMPTGTGKTKSLELVIRSRFLAGDCGVVAVVAPLRALCTEIANDLSEALGGMAHVRQTSDVMEIDPWVRKITGEKTVLVFTPEKFGFTIRHEPSVLDAIDMFVFDEAHLLDSVTRGPGYELLLTEMMRRRPEVQKIMISAVVSNPEQIAQWAFGDGERTVRGEDVQVTEKSLGFVSKNGGRIDFQSRDDLGSEDFFVPIRILSQNLKRGRERNPRLFPNTKGSTGERSRDLATYYADRLLSNGAVAIYVPQKRYMETYFKRLAFLMERGCAFQSLPASLDEAERIRLQNLVHLHYGDESSLLAGMQSGVLPHHGDLQGALRLSVEYALGKGLAKCVACTSTLAEGVNLPIKYLIITGVSNGTTDTKVRDFQNLIGRTARSGQFSEGSVLVVDDIADSRKARQYRALFNPQNAEECVSAILSLINDVDLYSGASVAGQTVVDAILPAIESPSLKSDLIDAFMNVGLDERQAMADAEARIKSLEALEGYIAGALDDINDESEIEELCAATYAYSAAEPAVRAQLAQLFVSIYRTMHKKRKEPRIALCAKTRLGLHDAAALEERILSPEFKEFADGGCSDLGYLATLFYDFAPRVMAEMPPELIEQISSLWISGSNLSEMVDMLNSRRAPRDRLSISRVERIVNHGIKFSMSYFVSCVIDAIGFYPDRFDEEPIQLLSQLQRKLKYGVSSLREVTICEELFDDRQIAKELVKIIGASGSPVAWDIKSELIENMPRIAPLISAMPSYCQSRFRSWLAG